MKKKHTAQSAFLTLCLLLGVLTFFAGILVVLFAATERQPFTRDTASAHSVQFHSPDPGPLTPSGDVHQEWVARYGGQANDYDGGVAIVLDSSGNVYVTGESVGVETGADYLTIKYNSSGQ